VHVVGNVTVLRLQSGHSLLKLLDLEKQLLIQLLGLFLLLLRLLHGLVALAPCSSQLLDLDCRVHVLLAELVIFLLQLSEAFVGLGLRLLEPQLAKGVLQLDLIKLD
jgi:hypothetical protein